MNEYKIGFSWMAITIFMLPMIVNIIYFLLPTAGGNANGEFSNKVLEAIEQTTRVLYLFSLVLIVSKKPNSYSNVWFVLGVIFLILYYIVWIRYFINGRDAALLGESFLGIPMPLAIFPVMYFIFAALWMHNYVAFGFMIVFGIVHNIISYMSFR